MRSVLSLLMVLFLVGCGGGSGAGGGGGGGGGLSVERAVVGAMEDGEAIEMFTLANGKGMSVEVMTYGATLIGVNAPDRNGKIECVTLRLDAAEDYLGGHPLFGSVVGRFANRIKGARFELDGEVVELTANGRGDHMHGGAVGFAKKLWTAQSFRDDKNVGVAMSLVSLDGEEGYPGQLEVVVTYRLTDENELWMEYQAETDKTTVLNLTNHAYWNLAGAGSGDVLGHELTIEGDEYVVSDKRRFPTGAIAKVKGTPLDFRKAHTIGERLGDLEGGYDHCYVIRRKKAGELVPTARVYEPVSGRVMEVMTTQPGVQLYTANGLSNKLSYQGMEYGKYHGLCLETQHYPDAPNQDHFPSTVLRPGEVFAHRTVHRFSIQD